MSSPRLTDYKVLVFDCYGTLADWETGIYEALQPLLARYPAAKWSKADALKAFESVEKDIQSSQPHLLYSDVLAKAHAALEDRLNTLYGKDGDTAPIASVSATQSTSASPDEDQHARFGNSVKNWPIFPDSSQALHDLAKHHAKLSTGDTNADASPLYVSNPSEPYWFPQRTPGSKSPFSLILTAQDVNSYKPAPAGFLTALDVIQKDLLNGEDPKPKVLWVAQSLFHDIEPAHRLGIRSTWINRSGASMGSDEGNQKYNWKFSTLGEMAEAVNRDAET